MGLPFYLVTSTATLLLLVATSSGSHDWEFPNFQHMSVYDKLTKHRHHLKILPKPEKELKYTFILVRHGMSPPDRTRSRTYLGDTVYKPRWRTDWPSTRGRVLMHMIGRSLDTRYHEFLEKSSWSQIKLTSMDRQFAVTLARDLAKGMFSHTKHKLHVIEDYDKMVESTPDFDKYSLLTDGSSIRIKTITNELEEKMENYKTSGLSVKYCNSGLYEALRQFVMTHRGDDEWHIDSPAKVYNLWNILLFEAHQSRSLNYQLLQHWGQLQACVFEYHRLLLNWDPDVASLLVGRMVNQVEEELAEGQVRIHVHVTDDLSMLAFNWTLPLNNQELWPDYGDNLIFDFYTDETVQVSTYSGLMDTFSTSYSSGTCEFLEWTRKRRLTRTRQQWESLFRQGQTSPVRIHPETEEDDRIKDRLCSEEKNRPEETSPTSLQQSAVNNTEKLKWSLSRKKEDLNEKPLSFETMVDMLEKQSRMF